MTKRIDADRVPALLRPGMSVFVAGGPNEPSSIIEALRRHPDSCAGVRFFQSIVPGMTDTDFCAIHPQTTGISYFITPKTRQSYLQGRLEYVPMQLSTVPDFVADALHIDLAIVGVSTGASQTQFGGGLNVDFLDVVLDRAPLIVAEHNAQMPTMRDASTLPAARIEYLVQTDRRLPELSLPVANAVSQEIGRQVAALIRDGDCIQTGVGAIPYCVLQSLREKNDLGIHSGILDDACMSLIEHGNVTGRHKSVDRGKHVAACAMGTLDFYTRAAAHPNVRFRPFRHTHGPRTLLQLDNFVSINSAMEIDLAGQINSEMINGSQVTGTGGAVDFMRAAAASAGGRSIVAFTATTGGGKRSRIVSRIGDGNAVTALRTDIDYVVTEFGTARLRYLSQQARAEALIELAAPQFREQLLAQLARSSTNAR